MVLGEGSSLSLTSRPRSPSRPDCVSSSLAAAKYISPPPGAWLDPANWRAGSPSPSSSPRPHSEQVPCQHDTAVFPANISPLASLTQTDVTVGQLRLAGRSLDEVGWRSLVRTEVGRRMFNVSRELRLLGHCEDRRGCECGTTEQLQEIICSHAGGENCQPAACSSPLRPRGHCCYNYCGAVISLTTTASLHTISTVASHHADSGSSVHVRRLEGDQYQIMLVPSSANLSAPQLAAAHIESFLMLELRDSVRSVVVEYSGAAPPPGAAARAATALGWITTFSLVILLAAFLHRKYNNLPPSSFSSSYSSSYSTQQDLAALRTRLEAQFRLVYARQKLFNSIIPVVLPPSKTQRKAWWSWEDWSEVETFSTLQTEK